MKMLANYNQIFRTLPKEYTSPLEKGDHPEFDLSPELDHDGIRRFRSVGSDTRTVRYFGSSVRVASHQGHLERLQLIYGYLKQHGAIRSRTGIPDHNSRDIPQTDSWNNSICGPDEEELPDNMTTPCGKPSSTITYEVANLMHCLETVHVWYYSPC
jgi:hypothetical protein